MRMAAALYEVIWSRILPRTMQKEIFLTYISPVHYNAIQRIKRDPSMDTLRRGSMIERAMQAHRDRVVGTPSNSSS